MQVEIYVGVFDVQLSVEGSVVPFAVYGNVLIAVCVVEKLLNVAFCLYIYRAACGQLAVDVYLCGNVSKAFVGQNLAEV